MNTAANDTTVTDTEADPPARPRRKLSIAAAVLVALLLPVSVIGLWNRSLLLDTDRYVETVAPLATDPVVQQAVIDAVTVYINDRAGVQARAEELLPDRARLLAPFIAGGAETLVRRGVEAVVTSEWFATAWQRANRADHAVAVRILTGRAGKVTSTAGGRIAVDLVPVAQEALRRLDERFGLSLSSRVDLSRHNLEFVLVQSDELARMQSLLRLAHQVLWFVVVLTVVAAAATVLAAGDRRLGALRVGSATVVSMAALLVAISAGRTFYLARLPLGMRHRPAPAIVYDILIRFLTRSVWILLAIGLVVVIGTWIAGPSGTAIREAFSRRGADPSIAPADEPAVESAVDEDVEAPADSVVEPKP